MNNISKVHDCYGCGVCATACGRKIIEIGLNAEGFYEPHITYPNKCTNCGICTEVCAYLHDDLSLQNQQVFFHYTFLVRSGTAVGVDELDTRVLPAEIAVYQDVCQFGGVLIVRTLRKTIQFLFGAEAGFGHSLAHLLAYEKAGRILAAFGQCLLRLLDDVRVKPAAER